MRWRYLGGLWEVSVPCISENTWKPVTLAGVERSCLGLEVEMIKYPKQEAPPVTEGLEHVQRVVPLLALRRVRGLNTQFLDEDFLEMRLKPLLFQFPPG